MTKTNVEPKISPEEFQKIIEEKDILIQKVTRDKEKIEKSYHELQQSRDHWVQAEKLTFAGRMAASVAHEIRNPLNMMVMSSQLLEKKLSKNASLRDLVNVFIRNLGRIDHLVTELVNCARPPKLKMTSRNIQAVVDSVINTMKEKCKDQNVKIVKDFNSKITKVRIDREHVEQAILNIAKNAIEAMPKGGTLTFSTNDNENNLVLSITDTGRGIPDRDMIRIFDPFFSTKKGGSGLGLAVCYAIIASHNGFINLRSKKGETCFTITLPIS